MIKAGIVGGTGFTGGELMRILAYHPEVEISWVYSRSQSGHDVASVHADLDGVVNQSFVDQCDWEIDVVFLCLPHETARSFVEQSAIPDSVKIVDLSRDYRLNPSKDGFVYGLPELNREIIVQSGKIANPGCFATAIQLTLLPLANKDVLQNDVHITGVTGSTGAGKGLSGTTHFTWRNNNISVYKALRHQHISEIKQSVLQLQSDFNRRLNFVPMRGNFTRGILASVYTETKWSQAQAKEEFQSFYADHPFVRMSDSAVDMKQVVGTNMVRISVEIIDGLIHIVSVMDNLIKGASGQAVQNMNLIFGLPETTGLHLKSIAY